MTDIHFHFSLGDDGLRFSFAKHAPPGTRLMVVVCFVAAIIFGTFAYATKASWAGFFAGFMVCAGFQIETWAWKAVARRCALGMYEALTKKGIAYEKLRSDDAR